jgi:hypothetical protein
MERKPMPVEATVSVQGAKSDNPRELFFNVTSIITGETVGEVLDKLVITSEEMTVRVHEHLASNKVDGYSMKDDIWVVSFFLPEILVSMFKGMRVDTLISDPSDIAFSAKRYTQYVLSHAVSKIVDTRVLSGNMEDVVFKALDTTTGEELDVVLEEAEQDGTIQRLNTELEKDPFKAQNYRKSMIPMLAGLPPVE